MGLCSSCLGRRKRSDDPEREPLLASTRTVTAEASTLSLPPPKTPLEKAADVIAALRAGKLPSQTQISTFLKTALQSQVIDPHALQAATSQAHLIGGESLSKSGRRLLADVRELIEASIEWGQAKNNDNIIQDLIYQTEHIHGPAVEADIAVSSEDSAALRAAIPSQTELLTDTQTLLISLRQLSSLLLTSSTFRLILSDTFLTLRSLIADTAAQTGSIASAVERVAGAAEEATRPGGSGTAVVSDRADAAISEASTVLDETRERWARIARESPDRVRDAVVGRMQNIVNRAQQTPEYRKAALALLTLIRSYASRVRDAPAATPVVWAEPHLERALRDLGTLLSRSANDWDLSPLLSSLESFVKSLFQDEHPEGRTWFAHIDTWLGKALSEPGYAISASGTRQAEDLYSQSRELFSQTQDEVASQTSTTAHAVLNQLFLLLNALSSDTSTTRLANAITTLPSSLPLLSLRAGTSISASAAYKVQHLRSALLRDLLSFALPRLLRLLGALQMPRVEFTSPTLDGAIDALLLTAPTNPDEPSNASASVLPDTIKFSTWNETVLDLEGGGGVKSVSRVRVHLDGLRISARKVGYYIAWRGPVGWVGYEDEGLISLDVGKPGEKGEGLSADVELEFDTDTIYQGEEDGLLQDNSGPAKPLFRVVDVKVDVPGLALKIDRSKHWIINKGLLQPLVGPVGRAAVRLAAAGQVRSLLEQLAQVGGDVYREVTKTRHARWHEGREDEDGLKDWVEAISQRMNSSEQDDVIDDNAEEEDESQLETETSVKPTTKGVVVTMTTSAADEDISASSEPQSGEATQTQIAIGLGAQILPGKGGPHDSHAQPHAPAESTREVLNEVEEEISERVQVVEENIDVAARKAEQVREEVEVAEVRAEVRMKKERRKKGWKSGAFDL